ncbi:MAG TPA: 50S ribosomal protein L11 methyltransferase [Gaiellaceae bacterium]|nr:50S ribosomal protein L11 methyltransferase [Gaiellaceae bacterium]
MDDERPLRRVSVTVPLHRAEEARAAMLELFPEGFEEVDEGDDVQLAAYTDSSGEERLWHRFGGVRAAEVERGWEERWRDFHRPVTIGPLWIGPPWEEPPAGASTVVIDPGRAFGTGAHATTRLCLGLLVDLPPGSLLDVGCGSGVIAIAGTRLGFAPVVAVDVDPVAVEMTLANAHANGVEVEASILDATSDALPAAAVAVANVSLAAAEQIAPRLACRTLVTSGYLASERLQLTAYGHVRRVEEEGWAADVWAATSE